MSLRVLGPLDVVLPSGRVPLGGPKQRLLLGLLAAWRGRTATVDELIDGLWPDSSQARPRKTLQVYITRLRAQLGSHAEAIRSDAGGYRLDVAVLPVDADEFEEATLDARRQDAATLRHALGLWRGTAFADLLDSPAIVPSAVYLDERRVAAQLALFELSVAEDPAGAVGELELAVADHPLHEGFAALLMRAQYAAGRQADALRTYGALRRRLVEELGLEPGPNVRELEGQILRHAVEVARPAAPTVERQRRRVTVLSAAMGPVGTEPGAPPDDLEAELTARATARRSVRSLVVQGGGVVLADAADELSACFGFPSEERSVERAVRAGTSIRDLALAHPSLAVRVGIDTGVVIVESQGAAATLTGIYGELLRVSCSLRDEAPPNEVLVGATTAAALGPAAELTSHAAGHLLVAWRDAVDDDVERSDGLVGRESTLAELRALAADATTCLQVIAVSGPAGIGKTALVDAFVAGLDESWAPIRVRCVRRDAATPLHPFRAELDELFATGEPTIGAVVAALQERAAGRSPLLLVVDDAHDADRSTLELLGELYRRVPSGLVVLTRRRGHGDDKIELDGEPVREIELGALDRATARALARRAAGEHRLGLEALNSIADRSGGVPLYVEALARAAVDGHDPAELPITLYDSLMSVLDHLGPARALAQLCAVVGPSFSDEELAVIAGDMFDEDARRAHLDSLVDAGVLVSVGDGGFHFTHALLADAAYESLLNADRRRLHARLVEAWPAAASTAEPHRLAFHLEEAGRPFEAAVAWRRASTLALRRASDAEGLLLARRARRLLDALDPAEDPDGGETRRRVLTNLAVALQATTHGSDELIDVIAAARAMPRDRSGDLTLDIIDISNRHAIGDVPGATAVARRALAQATAAGDDEGVAAARVFLGASLVWEGELSEALDTLRAAAAHWSDAATDSNLRSRTLGAMHAQLGLVHLLQDRPEASRNVLAQARAAVEGDPYGRCLAASITAVAEQLAGRATATRQAIEPVWTMALELATDFWLTWAQALLGWAIAGEGDGRTGMAMTAEAIDHSPSRQAMPYFCGLLGARLLEHGEAAEALARHDEGLAIAAETGEQVWAPLLLLGRARCLLDLGRQAEADAAAADAAARAAAMGADAVVRWCAEWVNRCLPGVVPPPTGGVDR